MIVSNESSPTVWVLNGFARSAVGARKVLGCGGRVGPAPKILKPLTCRFSSWKPSGPPKKKRAPPVRLKASCTPVSDGILMLTVASGRSTSTRPDGVLVKRTAPEIVKMSARLIVTAELLVIWPNSSKPAENSCTLVASLKATRMVPASASGSIGSAGSSMMRLITWPVLLMRTVMLPEIVRPSRPIRLASP